MGPASTSAPSRRDHSSLSPFSLPSFANPRRFAHHYWFVWEQRSCMEKPSKIAPPKGKLGILTPDMGAVSTTFMAGVELVRRGKAQPIGSVTQLGTIRLGKRTNGRSPLVKKFVPLADLKDIVFDGWNIFKNNAFEAASNAGVLSEKNLKKIEPF